MSYDQDHAYALRRIAELEAELAAVKVQRDLNHEQWRIINDERNEFMTELQQARQEQDDGRATITIPLHKYNSLTSKLQEAEAALKQAKIDVHFYGCGSTTMDHVPGCLAIEHVLTSISARGGK